MKKCEICCREINRTHFHNIRIKGEKYIVILSDGTSMTWEQWIDGGCEDLKNER